MKTEMREVTAIDRYVREVLHYIPSPARRARIEADLRSHFQAAMESGDSPSAVIGRMGDPREVAEELMAGAELYYAGHWARLAAFAVDLAVSVAVVAPLVFMGVLAANLVPREPDGLGYLVGAALIGTAASAGMLAIGVFVMYFPILEARFGQTLGKRLFSLHTVRDTGIAIGYKEAFIRRLPYYFDFLLLDALFVFFTSKRQRAFDIVARTVVIKES
jgi:uncharacterized RDD family membrane protein YckC